MEQQAAVQNTSDQKLVLPMREFDPVNPQNGATYIADEEYDARQQGSPAQPTPATADTNNSGADTNGTGSGTNDGGQQPAGSPVDFDSLVKEKTGGRFDKWDALSEFLESPVKFENEASKQIFDYLREGKTEDVTNFLLQQQVLAGVEKMDYADVIKMQMKIDDPDADPEDIELDFEAKYEKPDVDGMSEADAKRAMRKYERDLKRDGEVARESLVKMRQELKLPDLPKKQETVFKPEDIENEVQAVSKNIAESVDKALAKLDKLSFVVEDKSQGVTIPVDFEVSPEDKAELKNSFQDFFKDFETRYGQGDQHDGEKLAKERLIINRFDKILKSAVLSAYAKGKLDKTLAAANTDMTVTNPAARDGIADKNREAIERFITG